MPCARHSSLPVFSRAEHQQLYQRCAARCPWHADAFGRTQACSTSSCAGWGCRHLTDRVRELPLSVAARLVAPADVPALLAALLDDPPWELRLRGKGENGKGAKGKGAGRELQRFERGEWRAVEDKLKLCQHDIQVRHCCLCEPCRKVYPCEPGANQRYMLCSLGVMHANQAVSVPSNPWCSCNNLAIDPRVRKHTSAAILWQDTRTCGAAGVAGAQQPPVRARHDGALHPGRPPLGSPAAPAPPAERGAPLSITPASTHKRIWDLHSDTIHLATSHHVATYSMVLPFSSVHIEFDHRLPDDHSGVALQVALEQVPVLRPMAQLLDAMDAGYGAPGQDNSSARLIMEQVGAQIRADIDSAAHGC